MAKILVSLIFLTGACGIPTPVADTSNEVAQHSELLQGEWRGPLLAGEPGFALVQSRSVAAVFTDSAFAFSTPEGTSATGTYSQVVRDSKLTTQVGISVSASTIPELLTGANLTGNFLATGDEAVGITLPGLHLQLIRKVTASGDAVPLPVVPLAGNYRCSDNWQLNVVDGPAFFLFQASGNVAYGAIVAEAANSGSFIVQKATDSKLSGSRLTYTKRESSITIAMPTGSCDCTLTPATSL